MTPPEFPTEAEIERIFFKAALAGYVCGAARTVSGIEPGATAIYTDGDFEVHANHLIPGNGQPHFGTLAIQHRRRPVWYMTSREVYRTDALPQLREALRIHHERNVFRGGRGPASFLNGDWQYTNTLEPDGSFREFKGREELRNYGETMYGGWCEYEGKLLIPA